MSERRKRIAELKRVKSHLARKCMARPTSSNQTDTDKSTQSAEKRQQSSDNHPIVETLENALNGPIKPVTSIYISSYTQIILNDIYTTNFLKIPIEPDKG